MDRTVLDNAGVQRVVSAWNVGRRNIGEVGKRFLTGTILRTNAAEPVQTTGGRSRNQKRYSDSRQPRGTYHGSGVTGYDGKGIIRVIKKKKKKKKKPSCRGKE